MKDEESKVSEEEISHVSFSEEIVLMKTDMMGKGNGREGGQLKKRNGEGLEGSEWLRRGVKQLQKTYDDDR